MKLEKITGARLLIDTLIEQGVDTVFGYPGGAVLEIYDELHKQQKRIRHILTSHEQHAAHAADGYARSTGKTGVCIATSGPGATNLITGIAAAYMDSVPIVAITGNVSTESLGKDSFQEVDIAGISMPVVKHNWIVNDAGELAEIVREAFIAANLGRPGPVLIDIPRNISVQEIERKVAGELSERARRLNERKARLKPAAAEIDAAVNLIASARRPVIYAGGGVIISGASMELTALAESLNAPVALSLMGIGAIPAGHRLCTGLSGMHGTAASNKVLQKADLLIAAGARFSDRLIGKAAISKTAKVLHLDIDPAEINKNVRSCASVTGDLKEALSLINERLPKTVCSEWNGEIEKLKPRAMGQNKNAFPRFIIEETAKMMGPDCIAVTDVGQHQIWAAQFFPVQHPRSFISSGGLGAMGFGLGAACGAKIANPNRGVVLFTGDGSFRMNSAEMGTLSTYKLPVLIVVFNNGSLGMVRQLQSDYCECRYSATDLYDCPDFVKLADAYGIKGRRASDKALFAEALAVAEKELASGKSFLIDAVIDKDQ